MFEFSGYGDFSENHRIPARHTSAPGPGPMKVWRPLGYYSQFQIRNITTASIKQLIAANGQRLPHTPTGDQSR